jgi:hypothetical protein
MRTFAFIVAALLQLGGKPQPLLTPYQTESAWAMRETASDIAEMAAAARKVREVAVQPPPAALPWNPDALVDLAREQFGPATSSASASTTPEQYPALAQLTAAAVANASTAVSGFLRQNMRNWRAHESAALVVAAFGLREAADDLSDVRWALNRITAHLAVAAALRPATASASIDGQLARVAFLALANRSTSGLTALTSIADRTGDQPLAAWKQGLRVRLTGDWRIIPLPAQGFRLEKLEYLRARRRTLSDVRAGQELTTLREPVAIDLARIVQSFRYGVEDGHSIVGPALGGELMEIAEVHRIVQRRDLPPSLPPAVLNVRAGRLMAEGDPRVIPWGAWAEFFQRHVGNHVAEVDYFYRQLLGSPGKADEFKQRADLLLGEWTLFPIASAKRTKGRGTEADLRFINNAIAVAYAAPELVNYHFWRFLANGANYEVVTRGMPARASWFAMTPSAAAPYEAGTRGRDALGLLTQPVFEALVDEASSDVALHALALRPRPDNQALAARVVAWFKARAEFDQYAVDAAVLWSRTLEEDISWRQHGCALSVSQCVRLAWLYAYGGDDAKAAAEYERAFASPALDAVAMSNSSSWLVSYYERTNQLERAYDLAQRSADVGSGPGMNTLAHLYERRGRFDEAEIQYQRIAGRYQKSSAELAGFLFRQAMIAGKPKYTDRWKQVERQLFPKGLRKLPEVMKEQPGAGVYVYEDSAMSRRVRLQAGDIIVGVDGWTVEDREQYLALIAFSEGSERHRLTAWRGILFTVELPEDHGMDLQTFPLKGWIQ